MAGKKARRLTAATRDAWRNVSKIILRPGIRMMMRLDWRGQEHIPADGAGHPGRQPPVVHGHLRRLAVR